MLEKLKAIVLTEEQIEIEIYRIQKLVEVYKNTNKKEVLMYLNGKLETLNWIKEVQSNG